MTPKSLDDLVAVDPSQLPDALRRLFEENRPLALWWAGKRKKRARRA
jgi:hypothetical protein